MNNDLNDLIKRGAVCDMLHDEMDAWGNCADEIEALLKANDALWEIPAVDAVEVVRCKDCEKRKTKRCAMVQTCINCGWDAWTETDDDDFCSYGERKGDDA